MAFTKVEGGGNFPNATQFKFTAPGQEIEGKRLELSDRINGEFGEFRILVLETEAKEPEKVLLGGVLLDKFERADGSDGDLYKLVFKGLTPTKKNPNKTYKDYDVYIDRQAPKSNWDDKEAF